MSGVIGVLIMIAALMLLFLAYLTWSLVGAG